MSMRKMLKMDDTNFSNLLSFCYDSIIIMKTSSTFLSDKIEFNLNKFYFRIVQGFQNKYFPYFDLLEYFFSHNFNHPTLSLYVKFELKKSVFDPNGLEAINLSHGRKKSILFSLLYYYKRSKENFMISWKFDIMESLDNHTWILSECQEVSIYLFIN